MLLEIDDNNIALSLTTNFNYDNCEKQLKMPNYNFFRDI
jgi:hypothetical protein